MEIITNRQIELNGSKEKRQMVLEMDFGSSIADAIEKFGEEVVFNHFQASAKLSVQSAVAQKLISVVKDEDLDEDVPEYTEDEIREYMADWKLTAKTGRSAVSTLDKAKKLLAALPADTIQELLAQAAAAQA